MGSNLLLWPLSYPLPQVSQGTQRQVRLGGMAHGDAQGVQAVVTCDATVADDVWQAMFNRALAASFSQVARPGRDGCSRAGGSLQARPPQLYFCVLGWWSQRIGAPAGLNM